MQEVIKVNRNVPVLDVAVSVVEKLSRDREATVITSTQPTFVGIAYDLYKTMFSLYRPTHFNVQVKRASGTHEVKVYGKDVEGADRYMLSIILDEKYEYNADPPPRMEATCVINSLDGKYDIVMAEETDTDWKTRNLMAERTQRLLPQGSSPEPVLRSLRLSYQRFRHPINVGYHHFDKMGSYTITSSGKTANSYPVSEKHEHSLSEDAFELFRQPLHWNYKGWRCAKLFNNIADKTENMKSVTSNKDFLDAEETCFKLIEAQTEAAKSGKRPDFTQVAEDAGCPAAYRKVFLDKITKTLFFFGSSEAYLNPQRRTLSQNLVNYYNEKRAHDSSTPTITIEQLCGIVK